MNADQWRLGVISVVRNLSDRDFQASAWFGKSELISSPEELYCQLFDDFIFDDFIQSTEINLTIQQKQRALALKNRMEETAQHLDIRKDPKEIVDNPLWVEVRAEAKRFLESLTY